ncbi:putative bifunctional diguanylate cyclase/phosphodiesterase [Euzebya sp.]|uniref:putative bifunctional diguanylate cyclase/phosphodiesterase n=1 Tax=Euzebya sp. TaxID=1971409 RepID=UPI003518FB9E
MSTTPHLVASRAQRSSRVASACAEVLGRHSAVVSTAVLLLGAVAATVVVVADSPSVASTTYTVAGAVALLSLPLGVWLHRPRTTAPWIALGLAPVGFVIGTSLRAAAASAGPAATPSGVTVGVQDLFSFLGYTALLVGVAAMLHATGARQDVAASADGLMVMTGAAILAWTFLISPTLDATTTQRELGVRVVMAAYPVLDTLLLFLMARLALAVRHRQPVLVVAMLAFAFLLAGDTGYVIVHAGVDVGVTVTPALVDALHLMAFTCLAGAALHPTMRVLTDPQPLRAAVLERSRLTVVAVSMANPAAVILLRPPDSLADRVVLATGMATIAAAALWRTSTAVNDRARDAAAMAHAAAHDALTGLPNRTTVVHTVRRALAAARGGDHVVAVISIDLHGLKLVNESWGRAAGDELLVAVAARLRQATRPGTPVGRIGADEFAVVIEGRTAHLEASHLADHLLGVLADPVALRAGRAHVIASIGVAHSHRAHGAGERPPGDSREAEALVDDASAAMHHAKARGRNVVVTFDDWMVTASAERIELQIALRDAVADGAIDVAYQPLVDLGTGRLLGFEALARWHRPDVGPVPPVEFIPLAEETGLIVPLGEVVLSAAVEQLARWRRQPAGSSAHVSVNVAARQLADGTFADVVESLLDRHDLPGDALWLEITESVLVADDATTGETLRRLHDRGVVLAVDDFGTGYSSLGYLQRFPISALKIDRSFIADLGVDPDAEAIVAAVVAMARALDLEVVAEGIETATQHATLRDLGCAVGQGWLFGRPADADAATHVVEVAGHGVPPLAPT